eukprot:gb/GFBE01010268.1/.p1 GENE.gb/GFBE01010268.1/~~gb/GFBE01010268.1/.p1  ORF type:complete len:390 (+),score=87.90 gb/GFBE01010268.1/:1-1170(+)
MAMTLAPAFALPSQATAAASNALRPRPQGRLGIPTSQHRAVVDAGATSTALGAACALITAATLKRGFGSSATRRRGFFARLGRGHLVAVAAEAEASLDEVSVGSTVKVIEDTISFWHVPGSKGKPFNPIGLEGQVVEVIKGEHLTANRPILVKLTKAPNQAEKFKAFKAHFTTDEIEVCSDDAVPEEIAAEKVEKAEKPSGEVAGAAPSPAMATDDGRWVINLLYDGECPSCMKQVEFLEKRMDENPEYQGLVKLTDLHAPDYDPALCGGVVFEDGMRHIHAVTREGEVITGMDVFRRIYSIVGMQWVYDITTLPVVGEFFDWLYDRVAEYRLRWAGREDILESVKSHQQKIKELSETECEVECEVDWDSPAYALLSDDSPKPQQPLRR